MKIALNSLIIALYLMFLYTCTYKLIKKNHKKINLAVNKFIFIHNCINLLLTNIYLQ